jgi:hypothetical protein
MELFIFTLMGALGGSKERVFVGIQPGVPGGSEYSWTKCDTRYSNVKIVQIAPRTLTLGDEAIRSAALHEACHILLHPEAICAPPMGILPVDMRNRQILEAKVDECVEAHGGKATIDEEGK